MQSLFHLEHETFSGTVMLRQWSYATDGLKRNIEKTESFYQNYPIAVSSSHLLVRLIQTINISRNLSYERYIANCSQRALPVANALKLTNPLGKGQIWDGVFYGKDTKEIIIGHDTLFSITGAYENWKSLQPVTVLMNEVSNTSLLIPDGKVSSLDKGIAVIAINIPMLMAMYYRFNEEQDLVEKMGGARRTIAQFVQSYALTNMIRSQLDNAILNRFFNYETGTPNLPSIRKHSYFLNNFDDALDVATENQVRFLNGLNKRFSSMMRATQLPISGNLWNFAQLPDIPSTLQVFWALCLARIKILAFLVEVQHRNNEINARELSNIRRLMKIHQTRNVIRHNLGYEAYLDIAKYLDAAKIE